jgi:hypothetical protein
MRTAMPAALTVALHGHATADDQTISDKARLIVTPGFPSHGNAPQLCVGRIPHISRRRSAPCRAQVPTPGESIGEKRSRQRLLLIGQRYLRAGGRSVVEHPFRALEWTLRRCS